VFRSENCMQAYSIVAAYKNTSLEPPTVKLISGFISKRKIKRAVLCGGRLNPPR